MYSLCFLPFCFVWGQGKCKQIILRTEENIFILTAPDEVFSNLVIAIQYNFSSGQNCADQPLPSCLTDTLTSLSFPPGACIHSTTRTALAELLLSNPRSLSSNNNWREIQANIPQPIQLKNVKMTKIFFDQLKSHLMLSKVKIKNTVELCFKGV